MRSIASPFVGFIASVSVACGNPTAPATLTNTQLDAVAGQEVRLAIGQAATVAGTDLTLRLVSVVEDSRCPIDALCISAGNGKVRLEARRGNQAPETLELNTTLGTRESYVGQHFIKLVSLSPMPFAHVPTDPADYRATFFVSTRNPEDDDVRVVLTASRGEVAAGDTVTLTGTAINETSVAIQAGVGCSPGITFYARATNGGDYKPLQEIFTCEFKDSNILEPGETDVVKMTWRTPTQKGTYAVRAFLMGAEARWVSSQPVIITVY